MSLLRFILGEGYRGPGLNYLVGCGSKKEWARFLGSLFTDLLTLLTYLVIAITVLSGSAEILVKYVLTTSPFFLLTSILNRYGGYTPPVSFLDIQLLRLPIQGLEKGLDLLGLVLHES